MHQNHNQSNRSQMIICLTFTKEQVAQVESLLDWMFMLHGKKQAGAILLVSANDVHEEYRTKVRLAAEVAFEHVDMIYADAANLFAAASECIEGRYRDAWLYLEPDCVPLVPRWIKAIEEDYKAQPKKVMGPFLKKEEALWVAKNSVYSQDIHRFSGGNLTLIATKTRCMQIGKYEKREDVRDKSKDDQAYLFCGDKTGELMSALRSEMKK